MGNGAGTRSTLARMTANRYAKAASAPPIVTRSADANDLIAVTLGRAASDAVLANLAGGLAGSRVAVHDVRALTSRGFQLEARGEGYRTRVIVERRSSGEIEVDFHVMDVAKEAQGRGIASQAFPRMVAASRSLGVERIRADASRHDDQGVFGYKVWPRFGFDAPLRQADREALPPSLHGATTLLDLMQSRAGQQWWAAHGHSVDTEFDPHAGSRSMQQLRRYLAERRGRSA